jgi:hypothetical protein
MTLTTTSHSGLTRPATPTTLSPLALLGLLTDYVAETSDVLPMAPARLTERSYELLELTDDLEIWAIHWPRDQGLQLHDHGGSSGALLVLDGALEEQYLNPARSLTRRTLASGDGAAFGPSYIHDVGNFSDVAATSVHAYSPPMASMTFYRLDQQAGLVVERADYRADPAWAP